MIFNKNGEVVTQEHSIAEILAGEIVGQSPIKDGTVTLLIRSLHESELSIVRFDQNGYAKVMGAYESLEDNIQLHLNGPTINETLTFSNKILISDSGDLVVIGRVLR